MMLVFEKKEGRGTLNDDNKNYYFENTGRELTVREIRLIPYMVAMFQGKNKLSNLNDEELNILKSLNENGFIKFKRTYHSPGYYDIEMTEDYYFVCNEVLYMSYVCKAVGDFEKNSYSKKYIKEEFLEKYKPLLLKLKNAFQDSGVLLEYNDRMKKSLNKKDFSLIEKFKKAGFIVCEEVEEGKFKVGTTKRFWNQINNVLFPELEKCDIDQNEEKEIIYS